MAQKKAKASKARKPLNTKTVKGKMPSSLQTSSFTGTRIPPPRSSGPQSALVHRTTAETQVSEKHSLELAKTLMTATISTIAALRDIFPRTKYAIRTYDCADPQVTYESFMNGTSGKFQFERSEDTLNWRILTRGSDDTSRPVNKLLDWIELSATDALEKKYLAKLQLSFHSIDGNDVSDANLLEAYNICFTYEDGVMQIGIVEGENGTTNSIVLRGAKKDLYTLVNDLVCMIQDRDPLPDGRRMKMALLYNDTCPPDYQPPGFHADNNPDSLIAGNKGAKVGSMSTGIHGISVSLLQQQDLQASQSRQRNPKRSQVFLRVPSLSSEVDTGRTQEHGLKLLQSMGRHRAAGTQDTQPVNIITPQPLVRDQTSAISQATPTCLPYTQDVVIRIDNMRQLKIANQCHQRSYDLDELRSSGRLAACECGTFILEDGCLVDSLLQCDICDNLKHIHCYGYLGIVPPASKFACYSCLMDDEEMLSEMKETCVKRRALYYLRDHSALNSLDELAEHLGRKEGFTEVILRELELGGYVEKTANYQKARKGKGKSLEPLFKFAADDQKLRDHFFRPELAMAHFLALPASLSSGDSESPRSYNVGFRPEQTHVHSMASSIETFTNLDVVPGHTPYQQTATGDLSSTEGTLSPNSIMVRRHVILENQTPARTGRALSFGSSFAGSFGGLHPGTKRSRESTPDRELTRPVIDQQGIVKEGQINDKRKRTKISIVNSPWTFRNTTSQ